jgi:DNA-binding transcriptional regulator YdaS (Cro superfamily)
METNELDPVAALDRIISSLSDRNGRGGQSHLADLCGVGRPVVCNWRKRGGVPVSAIPQVAKATGFKPAQIRPDVAAMFRE